MRFRRAFSISEQRRQPFPLFARVSYFRRMQKYLSIGANIIVTSGKPAYTAEWRSGETNSTALPMARWFSAVNPMTERETAERATG